MRRLTVTTEENNKLWDAFEQIRQNDPTVNKMSRHGHGHIEIIVVLAQEKQQLLQKLIELSTIAPRKIKLPNGDVMIWHCPDKFVPEG